MIGPLATVLLLAQATSIEVRVPGPAGVLGGTLTLPAAGHAPFPAVTTLTGSGAHYRDGNRTPDHPYRPFRQIAERLAGCGVATLRLDDRGVGDSTGDANAATAEDTAADAEAALTFLRGRPEIDGRRLGDAVLLERAIRDGGNRHVQRHLFTGVNHHFQRDPIGAREGYDHLPTPDLAPEVLDMLCTWLPATLR